MNIRPISGRERGSSKERRNESSRQKMFAGEHDTKNWKEGDMTFTETRELLKDLKAARNG